MKVTQEKLPDSQVGLNIEVPADQSQRIYERVVQNLVKTTRLPGFRPGKVPRQILIKQLGPSRVKAMALEELLKESIEKAIEQENLDVLGNYDIKPSFEELVEQFTPGEIFNFAATVDVEPEVILTAYQELSIQAEETVFDPQAVEDWLEQRREQVADLVPVEDRPAQKDDVAIIDFQGYLTTETGEKGEAIAEVKGSDFKAELSDGKLVEGMAEGITGMNLEETKDVTAQFPADYPLESVAGQKVVFEVTLKELKTKELPDLDDDFAAEVSEFETLEELRESLTQGYQEEAEQATTNSIHEAIIEKLLELNDFPLPEVLIQEESNRVLQQTAMQMEQMGLDIRALFTQENLPRLRENARPEAIRLIKQELIMSKIAELEELKPEEAALEERFKELSRQLQGESIDPTKLFSLVYSQLRTEKVLEWLQEKATVELVPKGTLKPLEEEGESEEAEATEEATATETV
ncbi:MAG: trigger factor [Merismopediaceae bacterium]|nr:trigger factor [Merismopediaceae bacterium]